MPQSKPRSNSAAHWALYLLAAHESDADDQPRATFPELWSRPLAQDAVARKQTLSSALSMLYVEQTVETADHVYRLITRDESAQPYAYRLTDRGKRRLRTLGPPTDGVGSKTLDTAPPSELPPAAYDETGHGEPSGRPAIPTHPSQLPDEANPPRQPNRDEQTANTGVQPDATDDPQEYYATVDIPEPSPEPDLDPADADPATGPVETLFVDPNPVQRGHKRHIYVPADDEGDALVRRCGQEPQVRPRDRLTTAKAGAFEGSTEACKRCLRGVEIKRAPVSLDVDVESLLGETEQEAEKTTTVSLEPEWDKLATALEHAGYPGLAIRARQQDLSPAEMYGNVLDILYENRTALTRVD